MISSQTEGAKNFLRYLARATQKVEAGERHFKKKPIKKSPPEYGVDAPRLRVLENQLKELEKVNRSFEELKKKISEYVLVKDETELALKELEGEKIKAPFKSPGNRIKAFGNKLNQFEKKYNQLKKKGHSKKDLKKIKDKIDSLKKRLRQLKS